MLTGSISAQSRVFAALGLIAAASSALAATPPAKTAQKASNTTANSSAKSPANPTASSAAGRAQFLDDYGKLPLSFEANHGQSSPEVKFLSRGNGYSLFLTDKAAVLSLAKPSSNIPATEALKGDGATASEGSTDTLQMQLAQVNPNARVEAQDQLPGIANYFLGNDPAKWRTNVPTYSKVRYKGVYPGIDLVYYGNQGQLEYDFVVQPKSDPKAIQMRFAGANRLRLNTHGDLEVVAGNGSIAFRKPEIYQQIDGIRQPVQGSFSLLAGNTVGFSLGRYNHAAPLIIDPVLVYSTFLGGSGGQSASAIAVDLYGYAYVAGSATVNGIAAGFLTKINPTGSATVYNNYFGGAGGASATSIAIDAQGEAYVAGSTTSKTFPVTSGAFQTQLAGSKDGFIAKWNAAGSALVYASYLGGSGSDTITAMALNYASEVTVTGITTSTNLPAEAGFQPKMRGSKATGFVAQFNASGSALNFLTYLGGSGGDSPSAVAVPVNSGDIFVAGTTNSSDFPLAAGTTPFQNTNHSPALGNGFVAKLDYRGRELLYSTYLGGTGGDSILGLAVDGMGQAWLTGAAASVDFPVTDGSTNPNLTSTFSYCHYNGGENGGCQDEVPSTGYATTSAFLSHLSASGNALLYSSYIGGAGSCYLTYLGTEQPTFPTTVESIACGGDLLHSVVINPDGSLYLTGAFYSTSDTEVSGNPIAYAPIFYHSLAGITTKVSQLGGSGYTVTEPASVANFCNTMYDDCEANTFSYYGDSGHALAALPANASTNLYGNLYIAGISHSNDFPAGSGAVQPTNYSQIAGNAFVSVYNPDLKIASTSLTLTPSATTLPVRSTLTLSARVTSLSGYPNGAIRIVIDGGAPIARTASPSGSVTYSTSSLALGVHTISATYSGNSTYSPSAATPITVTVIEPTVANPAITPPAGLYTSAQSVKISDTTSGAAIYYTIDGTNPTASSTRYTAPISVKSSVTIKAIAIATGYKNSAISTAAYVIKYPAATPVFTPGTATYTTSQAVKITDATTGATIYYTLDGTTPTNASTRYLGPISVKATETIKAVAYASGDSASSVASATYTIQ